MLKISFNNSFKALLTIHSIIISLRKFESSNRESNKISKIRRFCYIELVARGETIIKYNCTCIISF